MTRGLMRALLLSLLSLSTVSTAHSGALPPTVKLEPSLITILLCVYDAGAARDLVPVCYWWRRHGHRRGMLCSGSSPGHCICRQVNMEHFILNPQALPLPILKGERVSTCFL